MRFRLRTLLVLLALGPAAVAVIYWVTMGFDKELAAGISTLIGLVVCVPAAVIVPLVMLIVAIARSMKASRSRKLVAQLRKTLDEKGEP